MPIMILVALAAAAGLYLMSKKGQAAPLAGPSSTDPAPDTQSPATAAAHDAVSPDDIARAFQVALQVETDPAKLDEFASSIPSQYADVAAQLHMRANEIRASQKPSNAGPSTGPQPLPPASAPDVLPPAPSPSPDPLPPFPVPDVPPAPQPAVAPADPVFPQPGSYAYVATHDTGPSGNLNLRASPVNGQVIESLPHNSWVIITDAPQNGWYPVVSQNQNEGWASGQYLAGAPV